MLSLPPSRLRAVLDVAGCRHAGVAAYARRVYRVSMTLHTRCPRLSAPLRGAILLLLLLATAAALALLVRPVSTAVPLDPAIPYEQALIDAGLSGTPGPDQPAQPAAVDRVLVDGAATYVQYHTSGPVTPGVNALLTLLDDRGHLIARGASLVTAPPGPPLLLPSWFPWHPPTIRRYVAFLKPLPVTAQAAVVRFPRVGEAIYVPLHLHTLARQPTSHPRTPIVLAGRRGVSLAVDEVTATHLVVTYRPSGLIAPVTLLTHRGKPIPLSGVASGCDTDTGTLRCRAAWVFPPQPHGAHLTLLVSAFRRASPQGTATTLHGPWRIPVLIP